MLLRINSLNVQYGKTTALNITAPITIEKGDRIGVIGSNGAGKSTLIKSLLGIVNYSGSVDSTITPLDMAVHMQFNEYTDSMATKHVMEAILQTRIKKNRKLQELISYFEFEQCLNKKFKVLSGGQKQRFTIILVMMQEAELTFYDEVTSGLDFETRQKLVEKLVSWYQGREDGLCVVSHYFEELEQLTNKLLILEQGNVIAFGDKEELFNKYCGHAVIVIDNNQKNQLLIKEYEKLAAPNHLIALACHTREIESEITALLIQNDVNYKRSNSDIELIFINAKEHAAKGGIGNEKK
ncbi:MAG TPA: ABC transporter ATP-binding protein [Clostridiales bacterium]|nr:ABC transporter ATP-binding protein [Clostridiales bacterium]